MGTKELDHGLDKDNTPCPSKRHLSSARVASQRKKRRTSLLRSLEATPLDGGEESGVSLESVELCLGEVPVHPRQEPTQLLHHRTRVARVVLFGLDVQQLFACNALGCSRLPHGTTS